MKVFKFGGASVKSAEGIKNLASILEKYSNEQLVVVVSAMGKTTNAMEELLRSYLSGSDKTIGLLHQVKEAHMLICNDLFNKFPGSHAKVTALFDELEEKLQTKPSLNTDFEYDQVVSYGELFSTTIVSEYLNNAGFVNQWTDIRECLKTDNTYREAAVNWELSTKLISRLLGANSCSCYITQGFIGATTSNITTTLGREGSDYTAAILANILNAEEVVIWKDVPGILNADPQYFEATKKLDKISYREAIELSYSGAKVIHPKTIKPLENKQIPLYVRSFLEPEGEGTVIREVNHPLELTPVFILKDNQVLLSISPKDFSFILEENISSIFQILSNCRIKVNMVQHSAISFSVAINKPENNFEELIDDLLSHFEVRYNEGLRLITIRHYNQQSIDKITTGHKIFVEQKTRNTARFLLK